MAERDPALVQDFLTESNELIEQLDADLVRLESETQSADLLDRIFRALHTIKGAASFLTLPELTTFAHAAEDALNRLRKGDIKVNAGIIDALLRSVDILRGQLSELADGSEISSGPQDLIDQLHKIAAGGESTSAAPHAAAPASNPAAAPAPVGGVDWRPLVLTSEKADVLPFMVSDLRDCLGRIAPAIETAIEPSRRDEAADILREQASSMRSTADYFAFPTLRGLVSVFAFAGDKLEEAPDEVLSSVLWRLRAAHQLTVRFADELSAQHEPTWNVERLCKRVESLINGESDPESLLSGDVTIQTVFDRDGVFAQSGAPASVANATPAQAEAVAATPTADDTKGDAPEEREARSGEKGEKGAAAGEQTVRVEVGRLEALLNLVGEMVLTKNQILGACRRVREHGVPHDLSEQLTTVVSDLDRLTTELQVGVMRTRMQPLNKLFGRYPRLIRDLARKTGKQVELVIDGGDTEVDKSVLELLADPMVHILRNSVDHGIEAPAQRQAGGKPAVGTLKLVAEHQGGHVRVAIRDDGKGIDRERVAAKAIERGMVTPEQVAQMSDSDVFRFIFAPGLSTADQVSDLSGRGVGMDVVRANIDKLGGSVNVSSTKGQGTLIEIFIPLTVAILPAMMVGIGAHYYAIPLASIVEIVRPEPKSLHSVGGRAVMRLRESVLPLVDMRDRLCEVKDAKRQSFAVVVAVGEQRAGLIVDRLIGQQEVVIKPIDDEYTTGGPFSGATIREDGDVSLILDVIQLVKSADAPERAAA